MELAILTVQHQSESDSDHRDKLELAILTVQHQADSGSGQILVRFRKQRQDEASH